VLILAVLAVVSVMNLYSATFPLRGSGVPDFHETALLVPDRLRRPVSHDHLRLPPPGETGVPLLFLHLALLVLVFLIGGSTRIATVAEHGRNLHPALEICKIALIILLARYFNEHVQIGVIACAICGDPFCGRGSPALILKQPDLGTALILLIISFTLIVFARVRWKSFLILAITSLAAAPFLWFHLKEYQQRRILTFLNPEMDPLGRISHQPVQDRDRIGASLGKGFSERDPDAAAFPPGAAHRFCLLRAGRGVGLPGGRLPVAALRLPHPMGLGVAGIPGIGSCRDRPGVVSILFWQLVINVCMTTGLLPVVGIPLVLLSYGVPPFWSP